MFKKKILNKIALFAALLGIPAGFLFFLSKGTQNFNKAPYYGIHTVDEQGDSAYFTLPNFNFKYLDGTKGSLDDFKGKFIISFILGKTCPHDCAFATDNFSKNMNKVFYNNKNYKDVVIVAQLTDYYNPNSLIIQDELNDFLLAQQAKGWKFILTPRNGFYDFAPSKKAKNMLEVAESKGTRHEAHHQIAVVIDKERHVRGIHDLRYEGEMRNLVTDIKLLKKEEDYKNR